MQGLKHGLAHHPLYHTWHRMMQRCHFEHNKNFPDYGGRGIKVCKEWHDPSVAIPYLNLLPHEKGQSIERIENDRGYEPGNVRFATIHEQNRNKRNNHWITHNGVTLCLKDWSSKIGINPAAIRYRLSRGWTIAETLETPKDHRFV